jgi:hypothetical protein
MAAHPEGLPPSISNQKTNKYIKEIVKRAGITEPITITKTIGGEPVSITKPKHDLIKTHTAMRSAATNMFLAGIPAISIMKITGHKTEASFMKYIKITREENARNLQDHSYFQEW